MAAGAAQQATRLVPLPAFRERRHCGFTGRLIVVCRRAILAVPEGQRPQEHLRPLFSALIIRSKSKSQQSKATSDDYCNPTQ
jgi:hypothetical protein